jgi:hypothetical protein
VPADEIEITPEMIEAGASELARFDRFFDTLETGAVKVFQAMLTAREARRPA